MQHGQTKHTRDSSVGSREFGKQLWLTRPLVMKSNCVRSRGWRRRSAACVSLLWISLGGTSAAAHPVSIGNRGGTVDVAETTLIDFDTALGNGTRWTETDVWRGADGVPVIPHDETRFRTTNGAGFVFNEPLLELEQSDPGFWFDPASAGEQIPAVAEALQLVDGADYLPLIEIKTGGWRRSTSRSCRRPA